MKTHLDKKVFAEALALLERVVPSKSHNPLLTYLSLALETSPAASLGDEPQKAPRLVLAGTNEEVSLRLFIGLNAFASQGEHQEASPVHVLVPAAPLAQVVRSLPGDEVLLEVGKEGLGLASGAFQTRLALADPEGFPELFVPEARLHLKALDLLKALVHVRYAASNEEYRGIFRGIQLEFGQSLRAVATDGYRLALYDLEGGLAWATSLGEPQAAPIRLVVPARAVDEMVRLLKAAGPEDEVALGFSVASSPGGSQGGTISLALAPAGKPWRAEMTVQLMEGSFPDYERVIPKEWALEVEVEAEVLKESLRRVGALASRENHRLDLLFEDGRLTLNAEGDYGKGREEVPLRTKGVAMSLSFNARYLLDALGPVEGVALLRFSGAQAPAAVSAKGDQEGGYLAVVVPLRV
ncbi:MAG: DNA polymerase III subunit beta [Thermus sp.]